VPTGAQPRRSPSTSRRARYCTRGSARAHHGQSRRIASARALAATSEREGAKGDRRDCSSVPVREVARERTCGTRAATRAARDPRPEGPSRRAARDRGTMRGERRSRR
jgi:hypothetical protein